MEKINTESITSKNFSGWLILEAISKRIEAMQKILENSKEAGTFEIEFSINGVSIPFVETVEEMENHIDKMVNKKAIKLIREKTNRSIEDLSQAVDAATRKFKRDLGMTGED